MEVSTKTGQVFTGIGADRDVVLDMLFDEITAQYFTGGF